MTELKAYASKTANRRRVPVSERLGGEDTVHRLHGEKIMWDLRVCIPATVVSFNPDGLSGPTVTVVPGVRERLIDRRDGRVYWQEPTTLPEVPVSYQQGGGFCATMPLTQGDEGYLIIADMDISAWLISGGVQNFLDRRRHDLSDAFFVPALNSRTKKIPNIATDAAELRKMDGTVKVRIEDTTAKVLAPNVEIDATTVTINAAGTLALNCATLAIDAGSITSTGDDIQFSTGSFKHHHHTGVQTGPSKTGDVTWT